MKDRQKYRIASAVLDKLLGVLQVTLPGPAPALRLAPVPRKVRQGRRDG